MSLSCKIKLFVLHTVLFVVLFAKQASSQLSAAQSYARNRPGVVMIKTNFSATIYVKEGDC
jgi:hypothetical protein